MEKFPARSGPMADIHCHLLYGADDGAKTSEMMCQMVRQAYLCGVRLFCMTPHYSPGRFVLKREQEEKSFLLLKEYLRKNRMNLQLCWGNELYYHQDAPKALDGQLCRTLNNTGYVLTEFHPSESWRALWTGVLNLMNAGYVPVIAHVERYACFADDVKKISRLRQAGCLIQTNADAVLGKKGLKTKLFLRHLLKSGNIDVVASDMHVPCGTLFADCYHYVAAKYGQKSAQKLFWDNPRILLGLVNKEREDESGKNG